MKHDDNTVEQILKMSAQGMSSRQISHALWGSPSKKSTINDILARMRDETGLVETQDGAKVLLLDIETAPIRAAVWRIWKENVGLNQIQTDWFLLSFSAKWLGSDEIIYQDLRGYVNNECDALLLDHLWTLLDECDIVVGHNMKGFDIKKINARFIQEGYERPSAYKIVDTLDIAKKNFGFTSNKLAYLTDKLCTKYKKSEHGKFHGFHLWEECLKDNHDAWEEMESYNKLDVLSLEELYLKLRAWDDKHPNVALHYNDGRVRCNSCGSDDMYKMVGKHVYTNLSEFETYHCGNCGSIKRSRKNVKTKEQMQNTLMNV
jgi:DNA-directed RNA polymerase subunit RPC12/RpoP